MKLFEVTNGYVGCSYVRCCVIAESREKALLISIPKFGGNELFQDFQAVELCSDTSVEWVSSVSDEGPSPE